MKIKKEVYEKIINSYPLVPPENGGIIGSKDGIICEYFHDNSSNIIDRAVYVPDVDKLNNVIEIWSECGIDFAGIIHSHIADNDSLSDEDVEYIRLVFNALPKAIDCLYFPIMLPEYKYLVAFIAKRTGDSFVIEKDKIEVMLIE